MTKDQMSLLLYLETRCVDHSGVIPPRGINDAERQQIDQWASSGFLQFYRVRSADLVRAGGGIAVVLSAEAIATAHAERIARAARMWAQRSWMTTGENRASPSRPEESQP